MPSKVKIYTRTGDKGLTSLYGGKRVSKANQRVVAYGTVDELNSVIGVLISHFRDKRITSFLSLIQSDLFTIGAYLAGNNQKLSLIAKRVPEMEKFIDKIDANLPELKNFILPQGNITSAYAHLVRSIARRAEREVIKLSQTKNSVDPFVLIYLNRLSDLLFVIARFSNINRGYEEIIWKSKT